VPARKSALSRLYQGHHRTTADPTKLAGGEQHATTGAKSCSTYPDLHEIAVLAGFTPGPGGKLDLAGHPADRRTALADASVVLVGRRRPPAMSASPSTRDRPWPRVGLPRHRAHACTGEWSADLRRPHARSWSSATAAQQRTGRRPLTYMYRGWPHLTPQPQHRLSMLGFPRPYCHPLLR